MLILSGWHYIILFRRIFNCCWQENPKSLLFYCGTLPALYTVDQRRIFFYKKLKYHSSILIRTIAKLCQHDILSVAAKYGWTVLSLLSRSPHGRHLLQLLVPAYPGCPGSKAVKRSSSLLLLFLSSWH